MNISKYNLTKCADRGATLKIKNPVSGRVEPGTTITCRGLYSTEVQRIMAERDKRKAADSWTDNDETQFNIDLIASCIISWDGFTDGDNDAPLECTPENVRALIADVGNHKITEQISAFVAESSNFFPKLDKG